MPWTNSSIVKPIIGHFAIYMQGQVNPGKYAIVPAVENESED